MRILSCIAALAVAWPVASTAAPVRGVVNPDKADWEFKPSPEMVAAAYPPLAMALGIEASTKMLCDVDRLGVLHDCRVVEIKGPKDLGFEKASLGLAPLFRLRPDRTPGGKSRNGTVGVPLTFRILQLKSDFPVLTPPPAADLLPLARQRVANFIASGWIEEAFQFSNKQLIKTIGSDVDPAVQEEVMADIRAAQMKVRGEVFEFQAQLEAANLTRQDLQAALDFEGTSGAQILRKAAGAIRRQAQEASAEKHVWLLYGVHKEFCAVHDCKSEAGAHTAPTSPPWIQQPARSQIEAARPKLAGPLLVGGYADLDCASTDFGILVNCQVTDERPAEFGFGAAALAISSYYRRPPAIRGERTQLRVDFPFPDVSGLEPPTTIRKQGPKYVLAREVVGAEGSRAVLMRQSVQAIKEFDHVELPGVSETFRNEAVAIFERRLGLAADDMLAEQAERYADLLTEAELRVRLAYVKGPSYAALVAMDEKKSKLYQQLNEVIYARTTQEAHRLYCAKHDCPQLPTYRGPSSATDPLPPLKP